METQANKDTKPQKVERPNSEEFDDIDSEDEEYQKEKVYVQSLTTAVKPVCPEKKYYHVPFEGEKPCAHVKFPFEDQRRRHYNLTMILKMYHTLVIISCSLYFPVESTDKNRLNFEFFTMILCGPNFLVS